MKNLKDRAMNKKASPQSLLDYGFIKEAGTYTYTKSIMDDKFLIVVKYNELVFESKVIDKDFDDEYTLVDVESSSGAFISKIKEEYQIEIDKIIESCFETHLPIPNQAALVKKYIMDKYGDELEFLWEKSPSSSVFRNKKTKKWYALFQLIPKKKLGLVSVKTVEIIDLRYPKSKQKVFIDNKRVFAGYHMNKDSWITIILDGSFELEELKKLIDQSYIISNR